jgi:hypothetical protein
MFERHHDARLYGTAKDGANDDITAGGSLSVDREAMLALYGESYTGPIAVLRGQLPLPDSFKEHQEEMNAGVSQLAAIHAV